MPDLHNRGRHTVSFFLQSLMRQLYINLPYISITGTLLRITDSGLQCRNVYSGNF